MDGMLTEILNDAVHIINPSYSVDLMANFYFFDCINHLSSD
ncbi:hypothetical protein NWO25_02535 [Enterococcus lactis]|nr:hypothetical protein [Enterococcus lactis]